MSERHENVKCDLHMHVSPEIIIVTEGELKMSVRGVEYRISVGQGLFVAPFEAHSFVSEKPNKCHVLVFTKNLLSYMEDFLRNNRIENHLFSPSPALLSMVEAYLPDGRNFADSRKAEAILSPLLYEIYEGCEFSERGQRMDDRLLSALEYMKEKSSFELTLEDVARVAGIHPVTLSKSFSRRTGTTFGAFLKFLRATSAAELIRKEKITFTEVAIRAGFGSVRSFNRAFAEVYGITPTEYRNSLK